MPSHLPSSRRLPLASDSLLTSGLRRFGALSVDTRLIPHAVLVVRFDLALFDASAFDACGIAQPGAIRNSVCKRQAEYFFGRIAARLALSGLGIEPIDIATGPHREPLWPPQVTGSISHNREYAAAMALGTGTVRACGIDIEAIAQGSELDALLAMVVNAAELDLLMQFKHAMPPAALVSLAFSAKESFFKAAFAQVGRYFDFDAVEVSHIAPEAKVLTLVLRQPLAPGLQPGQSRQVHFSFLDASTVMTQCVW